MGSTLVDVAATVGHIADVGDPVQAESVLKAVAPKMGLDVRQAKETLGTERRLKLDDLCHHRGRRK